jgi:ADP-glucose type glycogen/starch synthase
LIHCHDWTTALVPAFAKRHGIPCILTVHNTHSDWWTLDYLEDRGIDAASFWQHLFFGRPPHCYEETRSGNPCDLLASGIFAADFVNVVSPNFLEEILQGYHDFVPDSVRTALRLKAEAGYACGITNSPDASYDPVDDPHLPHNYGWKLVEPGKTRNKIAFQERLGLEVNPDAPILFWPSRLDPVQKGCALLTDLLYAIVSDYDALGLQVAAVANGPYECHMHAIIARHGLHSRVACVDFDEELSRWGFAAADFVLMPSLFEPCGLPQMIGAKYGALPIARNTGGIHDTVEELDCDQHSGNGFRFDTYDTGGLRWAIDRALAFFQRPLKERSIEIQRVMRQARRSFGNESMISAYTDIYEEILQRPLVPPPAAPAGLLSSPLPVAPPAPIRPHSGSCPEETGGQRHRASLEALKPRPVLT